MHQWCALARAYKQWQEQMLQGADHDTIHAAAGRDKLKQKLLADAASAGSL